MLDMHASSATHSRMHERTAQQLPVQTALCEGAQLLQGSGEVGFGQCELQCAAADGPLVCSMACVCVCMRRDSRCRARTSKHTACLLWFGQRTLDHVKLPDSCSKLAYQHQPSACVCQLSRALFDRARCCLGHTNVHSHSLLFGSIAFQQLELYSSGACYREGATCRHNVVQQIVSW